MFLSDHAQWKLNFRFLFILHLSISHIYIWRHFYVLIIASFAYSSVGFLVFVRSFRPWCFFFFYQAWVAQFIDWMHYSQKSMKLAHFSRFLFHLQAFCWVGHFLRWYSCTWEAFLSLHITHLFFIFYSYLDNKSLLCMQWDMRRRLLIWFYLIPLLCVDSCKHPSTPRDTCGVCCTVLFFEHLLRTCTYADHKTQSMLPSGDQYYLLNSPNLAHI